MLLLSTDTSGKHGSIALARGNADNTCDVIEVVPLVGGTFSAQLVPQIVSLLAKHGFTKEDIGAFVVASGPGSFTGLRVGLAAIKALAEILEKPIAAVSLLEVIALAGGAQGTITAVLDAGRGEVYAGEYEVEGNSARCKGERLTGRDDAIDGAQGSLVIGPMKMLVEAAQSAGLQASAIEPVNAGEVAKVGWRKIRAGGTVSPEQLEANYIRRSDAEIFAKSGS